jgi:hypothetical protein
LEDTSAAGILVDTLAFFGDFIKGEVTAKGRPFEMLEESVIGLTVDILAFLGVFLKGETIQGGVGGTTGPTTPVAAFAVEILARLGDFVDWEATANGGATAKPSPFGLVNESIVDGLSEEVRARLVALGDFLDGVAPAFRQTFEIPMAGFPVEIFVRLRLGDFMQGGEGSLYVLGILELSSIFPVVGLPIDGMAFLGESVQSGAAVHIVPFELAAFGEFINGGFAGGTFRWIFLWSDIDGLVDVALARICLGDFVSGGSMGSTRPCDVLWAETSGLAVTVLARLCREDFVNGGCRVSIRSCDVVWTVVVGFIIDAFVRLGDFVKGGASITPTGPLSVLIKIPVAELPIEIPSRFGDFVKGGDKKHAGPFKLPCFGDFVNGGAMGTAEPLIAFEGRVTIGPPVNLSDCWGDFVIEGASWSPWFFDVSRGAPPYGLPAAKLALIGDFVLGETTSNEGAAKLLGVMLPVVDVILARRGVLANGDANVAWADQESPDGGRQSILRTIMKCNSLPFWWPTRRSSQLVLLHRLAPK